MPRKVTAPWPVRVPLIGDSAAGQSSSEGLVGPTIDVDDDAQWQGIEDATEKKLSRRLRARVERLIASARLDYQNPPTLAADVIKQIKKRYRDTGMLDSHGARLARARADAAARLARIHLDTNEWSPHDANISQFANARLPQPMRGRRPTDDTLRRLIVGLEKVFQDATGDKVSATGFNRTVGPTTVRGVRYKEGTEYGPFLDFVRAVLRFVPEAPSLTDRRLATLVQNRPRKREQ